MNTNRSTWSALLVLALAVYVLDCDKSGSEDGDSVEITAEDREAAQEIYENRCLSCHGANGAGDGPASAALNPQPRNFSSPDWHQGVTDDHIEQIIVQGGPAVGMSAAMPNNPDLRQRPAVVAALREIVRGFEESQ